jgi:uncharacterized membrane protein
MTLSINVMSAVKLVILAGVVFAFLIPLYYGKVKMNPVYGIRVRKAFASEENWYRINRYGAVALMYWAALLAAAGILCLYMPPESVLTVAKAGFISVIIPVVSILYYAKKL